LDYFQVLGNSDFAFLKAQVHPFDLDFASVLQLTLDLEPFDLVIYYMQQSVGPALDIHCIADYLAHSDFDCNLDLE
jgi:hypothetical protein